MKDAFNIGLIGDYDPAVRAHQAIPKAITLVREDVSETIHPIWHTTIEWENMHQGKLQSFDAFWSVPASPYKSMAGGLRIIQFARESRKPFLGTCGGFQHALIEYVRNVVGKQDADHAESNPHAATQLIAPLSCSLIGQSGSIAFLPQSKVAAIYGSPQAIEEYHCNYGFNRKFEPLLEGKGMIVSGRDGNGEPRVVELSDHPFFIATLFQPELSALGGRAHPLIRSFVKALPVG